MDKKLVKLRAILKDMGKTVVAFSGGTDSTFLAAAAHGALGGKAVAVTAVSASLTAGERKEAAALAGKIGIKHFALDTAEFDDAEFTSNTPERCYHCKRARFKALLAWALKNGYSCVAEGSNVDDRGDYRPGRRAVAELGVRSPLEEAGLNKAEIRAASKALGLPNWDKPAAACLVSRIEYGLELTPERLRQVGEAEKFLKAFCKGQLRVRHHGDLARIEAEPGRLQLLARPDIAAMIDARLKKLGFRRVVLDLAGYRMGSMNEGVLK